MIISDICKGRALRIAVGIMALVLVMAGGAGATKFIRNDATGGDCTSFGTWNAATKTCTMTTDLTEGIGIINNGVTLDGNERTITGNTTDSGIFISDVSDVLIKNMNINNFDQGVYLYNTSNINLIGNNESSGYIGIIMSNSSDNTLSLNNVSNNTWGISVFYSINNTLNGNTASKNEYNGIYLDYSSNNNMLIDNTLIGNSDNISIGIQLRRSSNILLTGNNVSNNNNGIYLFSSSNDTVSNNNALNNSNGLFLDASSNNNTLTRNNFSYNNNGIRISSSSINTLSSNNASNNNKNGIYLTNSSNNIIYNNYFNNINNYRLINGSGNIWNITGISGINIIGGSYLGGNFWAYPNGTGFSQTCPDTDNDGICDSSYALDINNTDYLPLAQSSGTPVESSTGNGTVFFNTDTGAIENLMAVNISDIPEAPPGGANLYYGLFRFNITGITPGSSVNLTLTFPNNLPAGATYWKYGANASNTTPHWYTIPITINGNKLIMDMTDGGIGDDDLAANGRIKDDGGPSIFEAPIQVTNPGADPAVILNDNGRARLIGTNITHLNITVTGNVSSVTIDLSPIGGLALTLMTKIPGTDTYTTTTIATSGINLTNNLVVNATDISGNFNNSVSIPLTVLLRGDIVRDNKVDLKDLLFLRRYLVGKETSINMLAADIQPAEGDGTVDLKDLLFLRRYLVGKESLI